MISDETCAAQFLLNIHGEVRKEVMNEVEEVNGILMLLRLLLCISDPLG